MGIKERVWPTKELLPDRTIHHRQSQLQSFNREGVLFFARLINFDSAHHLRMPLDNKEATPNLCAKCGVLILEGWCEVAVVVSVGSYDDYDLSRKF